MGNRIVKFKKGSKGKKRSEEEGWHLEDIGLSRVFTPKVVKPFSNFGSNKGRR